MAVTGMAPGVAGESILVSKASVFDLDILENVELSRRDSRTFLFFSTASPILNFFVQTMVIFRLFVFSKN